MTTTTKTNSSLIFAIDQGTSSSRVIVFRTSDWDVVALHQVEFDSLYPEEGWCEQDPMLILQTVKEVPKAIFVSIILIFQTATMSHRRYNNFYSLYAYLFISSLLEKSRFFDKLCLFSLHFPPNNSEILSGKQNTNRVLIEL